MRKLQNRLAGIVWMIVFVIMLFAVGESDRQVLEAQQAVAYYH